MSHQYAVKRGSEIMAATVHRRSLCWTHVADSQSRLFNEKQPRSVSVPTGVSGDALRKNSTERTNCPRSLCRLRFHRALKILDTRG